VRLGLRYLTGVAMVAAGGAVVAAAVPAADRSVVGWGIVIGLVLQTPLGWWAIRSIGTERFMAVWGLGMLVRLTVVAVVGFAVLPVLGRRAGSMLGSMVGVLVALLLVEGATALREHSREDQR
jgi:4-amino-4-deoxy-L-arabinose transferase-like glycosyltransferase